MQLYEGGQQYAGITTFCKTKLKEMGVSQGVATLLTYYLLLVKGSNT